MLKFFILSILSLLFLGCAGSKIEKQPKFTQARININYQIKDSKIYFNIKNSLHCPIRISLNTADKILLQKFDTITLQSLQDSIYVINDFANEKLEIKYFVALGDLKKEIKTEKLSLPFAKNTSYKVMQGHDIPFSHNNDESRFAIDFNLKINDTVKSADDGFVVELFDQFDVYGKNRKFEPFANYITIYNERSGIFTQYVHLKKNGSFVKIGDKISRGQSIAITGLSGFMDGEHLHFNARIPSLNRLKSIIVDFENNRSSELKKGDIIVN